MPFPDSAPRPGRPGYPARLHRARMAESVMSWVRITVEIDGHENVLGQAWWMHERGENPERFARQVLTAWDEARAESEETLRLYGAEGVARALLAAGSGSEGE